MKQLTQFNIRKVFNGLYEPGSDSFSISTDIIHATKDLVSHESQVEARTQFEGFTSVENGTLIFKTLGGGRFELRLTGMEYDHQRVTVTGIQDGGVIHKAHITVHSNAHKDNVMMKTNFDGLNELGSVIKNFISENKYVIPEIIGARPGYRISETDHKKELVICCLLHCPSDDHFNEIQRRIGNQYSGYPIIFLPASPRDILLYNTTTVIKLKTSEYELLKPTYLESFVLEYLNPSVSTDQKTYSTPESASVLQFPDSLEAIEETMDINCFVSPDAGWAQLRDFLSDTEEELLVSIYDFSAPQLANVLEMLLKQKKKLKMKLVYDSKAPAGIGQGTKVDDLPEDDIIGKWSVIAGKRFNSVGARKGATGICANSYHSKIAVRDKASIWLSSGNWQSSNIPNVDFSDDPQPSVEYNREWNIIVHNEKIASLFKRIIEWDYEQSINAPESGEIIQDEFPPVFFESQLIDTRGVEYFEPQSFTFPADEQLKIQPLLTPGNYMDHIADIIQSAKHTLYFQNQYINISQTITEEYNQLLTILSEVTNRSDFDCKIILRQPFSRSDRQLMIDNLLEWGFDISKIKFMKNCHTKGIIVDSDSVIVGSHNWSNSGVQFNRDASLIIYNPSITAYYRKIFMHDWERRAYTIVDQAERESAIYLGSESANGLENISMTPFDWDEYSN